MLLWIKPTTIISYFDQWNKSDIYFVTRLKNNAQEELTEEFELKPATPDNILTDAKIALTYKDDNGQEVKVELRLVSFYH